MNTCCKLRLLAAFLVILGSVTSSGCDQSSSPQESAKETAGQRGALRVFDILNIDVRDVPMMMAFDELEAKGYTVEKTYMASTALIADALVRGDADIGIGNNQIFWRAIAEGAPIRTIGEFTAPTHALIATTDIQSCGDLDGKRLGVPTTRGLPMLLLNMYLEQSCPGTTPQLFVIVQSTGRAAALLAGEIDASLVPGEELIKLQLEMPDKFHGLMSFAGEFPNLHMDGLHVRREWADRNPEGVKDFLRALLRAQRQVVADPQLLFDESVKRLELEPAVAEAVGRSHLRMGIWRANGGLTAGGIQETVDFLSGAKVLSAGRKAGDVADLSYLDEILDELGRQ